MSLPKSIRTGELKLGNITMIVHVLEDGQRVIEEESMIEFVKALNNGTLFSDDNGAKEAEEFAIKLKSL